jgi:metal-responsive CopG/Arc/MetJ family transcriptional regulator
MKTKTSVTLDAKLLQGIDQHRADYRSRSEFIESAVAHFISHLERAEADRRDLLILNQHADALHEEAEDVLAYQVNL